MITDIEEERWFQVTSNYFCTGIKIENHVVTKAAPIVGYMHGWTIGKVYNYCEKKDWDIFELVDTMGE